MTALRFLIYIILTIIPQCIPNSPNYTPPSSIWRYTTEVTNFLGLYLGQWLPIDTVTNAIYRHWAKIWKGMCTGSQRSNRGQFNRPR